MNFDNPLKISTGEEKDKVILKIYQVEKFLIPKKNKGRKMQEVKVWRREFMPRSFFVSMPLLLDNSQSAKAVAVILKDSKKVAKGGVGFTLWFKSITKTAGRGILA